MVLLTDCSDDLQCEELIVEQKFWLSKFMHACMTEWPTYSLTEWSSDWQIDRLADWVTDWLSDREIGWPRDPTGKANWLSLVPDGWMSDWWINYKSTEWLSAWMTLAADWYLWLRDWLIHWRLEWLTDWWSVVFDWQSVSLSDIHTYIRTDGRTDRQSDWLTDRLPCMTVIRIEWLTDFLPA